MFAVQAIAGVSAVDNLQHHIVPGDAGIWGIGRASTMAGLATISDGQPQDHADIINNLRGVGRVEDFGVTLKTLPPI